MSYKDLKPNSKIRLGIILIIMIVLFLGGIAIMQMNKLSQLTYDMYNHPLSVSKALLEIEANVNAMQRSLKDVALSETPEALKTALSVVEFHEQQIQKYYTVLYEKYLGERQQIDYAHNLSLESKAIRDEVIALRKAGSRQAAMQILTNKGASHINSIFEALDPMIEFAEHKALQLLNESQARQNSSMGWLAFTLLLIAGSAYFVLGSTIRTYLSSEKKYASLIHNMRDGVTIGSVEGALLYVNPSYATMLGYSHPDELIGTPAVELYANPEERADIIEQLMIEGFIDSMELNLIKKDGSLAHVLVSAIAKKDAQGHVKEIESIVTDITGSERYESILKQSEQKFKSVTESTVDAIVSFSRTGHIISWNPAAEAIFQYTKMEILSKSIKQILPDNINVIVGGETSEFKLSDFATLLGKVLELEALRKDGSSISIELTLSSWSLEKEQYFTAIIRDISERKQAAVKLLESESRLKMVMHQSPSVIEIYNLDGLQIGVNKAYEKLWGFPAATTVNIFNVLKSEEVEKSGLLKYVQQAYAGQVVKVPEYQFDPRGDTEAGGVGRVRWLNTQIYPLKDGEGKVENIVISHEDITDSKNSSQKLMASEQKFRGMIENLPLGIHVYQIGPDQQLYFQGANSAADQLLGINNQKLIGMTIEEAFPDIVGTEIPDEFRSIANGEMGLLKKHDIPFQERLYDNYNFQVQEGLMVSAFIDITDHRRAQRELAASEQHYRNVVQDQTEFILRFLPDGTITFANDSYCRTFGITYDEVVGSNFFEGLPVMDMKRVKQKIAGLSIENQVAIDEHEMVNRDGQKVWHTWSDRGLFDEDGELTELQVVGSDITQRKQIEAGLNESLEQNKAITETAVDAIISIDSDGLVILWNKSAEKIFGFTSNEMVNKSLKSILPKKYQKGHKDGLKRLREGGADRLMGTTIEISAVHKNGSIFPIDISLSSWRSNDRQYFTGIIRDISDRKQAELEIADALLNAEQANKVKDQFIANISHEIRTPLNSIIGFSDLFFQRYGDQVLPRDKEIFGYITSASNRLMHTVDSILNLSLLKSGNLTLQPKTIDLNIIVSKIITEQMASAKGKGLILDVSLGDKPAMIYADEYCTYQSILNLTENAVKFTYEGTVQLEVAQINGNITLLISDTGIGMSEEYQSKIFTPYSQESEGFTKTYQGIGLGLAITKQFLDLNQIGLKLVSQVGVGSTFTLVFPITQEVG